MKLLQELGKKLKAFTTTFLCPWFFSVDGNRIKAPYVISTVFLSLTVYAIILFFQFILWQFEVMKELWNSMGMESIPMIIQLSQVNFSIVSVIGILVGSAGLFIGLYNWGKKKKPSIPENVQKIDVADYSEEV